MAEPPYGAIWASLVKGKVVPFLGAGASIGNGQLTPEWTAGAGVPPTGRQLARWLADQSQFPEPTARDDLAKVASYYQASVDRTGLVETLSEVFSERFEPGNVHRFLADVPVPMLIVTTNYDDLVEQAFDSAKRPYHLVVHPTDRMDLAAAVLWWKPGQKEPEPYAPAQLPLTPGNETIIYKMHGSVDRSQLWNSFVITEEDYVEFLARMAGQLAVPAHFLAHFQRARFLFLGYGLGDWNLRVMLKSLKEATIQPTNRIGTPLQRDSLRSWAIQHGPSELERWLWDKRDVNIYDIELAEFVDKLRAAGLRAPSSSPRVR